jgi:hypothetical protein
VPVAADRPGVTIDAREDAEEHKDALRASVLRLRAPQVSKRAPAPTSSVFGRAAAAVPGDVRPPATREALGARFRNVETTALMSGTSMVLVVLPDDGPVPAALMRSLDLVVRSGGVAVVLAPDVPRDVERSRPLTLPLRGGDALASEWALLALGPGKRVAFLARRRPDDTWDWMITRDQVAVQRAGTAILDRVPFLRLRVPVLQD